MIMIIATFGQALSGQAPAVGIVGVIIVWRFIVSSSTTFNPRVFSPLPYQMGVGIGGDYPLSAIISSEFAATRIRGRLMTAVFAFQGWGQFSMFVVWIRARSYGYFTSFLSHRYHRRCRIQEFHP